LSGGVPMQICYCWFLFLGLAQMSAGLLESSCGPRIAAINPHCEHIWLDLGSSITISWEMVFQTSLQTLQIFKHCKSDFMHSSTTLPNNFTGLEPVRTLLHCSCFFVLSKGGVVTCSCTPSQQDIWQLLHGASLVITVECVLLFFGHAIAEIYHSTVWQVHFPALWAT
jgi:hypothetical protein